MSSGSNNKPGVSSLAIHPEVADIGTLNLPDYIAQFPPEYGAGLNLNSQLFSYGTMIKQFEILTESWRNKYNMVRLQSSLGYSPPGPEARLLA